MKWSRPLVWKTLSYLLLVFLMVVGAYLRFHGLIEKAYFDIDMSRDTLAVDHIVRFHENHMAVPMAGSGFLLGKDYLSNSVFYYYLLIPFYLLWPSPQGLLFVLNIIAVVNVLVIFTIAKKLGGSWAGFLSAAIFSLHISVVLTSRDIWQPFFMEAFLPLFFFCLVESWLKKSKWPYWSTIILFGLLIHFHLSIIAFSIPYLLYLVDMASYFFKHDRKTCVIGGILVICSGLLWMVGTYQVNLPQSCFDLVFTVLQHKITQPLSLSTFNLEFSEHYLYSEQEPLLIWYLPLLLLLGTVLACRNAYTKMKSGNLVPLKILVFMGGVFIAYLFSRFVFAQNIHYFLPFQAVFIIWLGYCYSLLTSKATKTLILMATIAVCLFTSQERLVNLANYNVSIVQKQQVSQQILQHELSYKNKADVKIGLISAIKLSDSEGLISDGHAYWYYLEKLLGRQLVSLDKLNATVHVLEEPTSFYLICQDDNPDSNTQEVCIEQVKKNSTTFFETYSDDKSKMVELELPASLWNYRIFSLTKK